MQTLVVSPESHNLVADVSLVAGIKAVAELDLFPADKEIDDVVTVLDAISLEYHSVQSFSLNFDDAVATADTVVRAASKAIADTPTAADALALGSGKALVDTQATADGTSLAAIYNFQRAFSDTVLPLDNITLANNGIFSITLNDSVAGSDSISLVPVYMLSRALSDAVTPTDAVTFAAAPVLVDTPAANDNMARSTGKPFADTATAADSGTSVETVAIRGTLGSFLADELVVDGSGYRTITGTV